MRRSNHTTAWVIALSATFLVGGWSGVQAEEAQFGTPKGSEGTRIFKATEHPFYSGEFRLKG
jgi:hypothetical protein